MIIIDNLIHVRLCLKILNTVLGVKDMWWIGFGEFVFYNFISKNFAILNQFKI